MLFSMRPKGPGVLVAAAQVLNEAFWNSQLKGTELVFLCFSQSKIFLINFRIPKKVPNHFFLDPSVELNFIKKFCKSLWITVILAFHC